MYNWGKVKHLNEYFFHRWSAADNQGLLVLYADGQRKITENRWWVLHRFAYIFRFIKLQRGLVPNDSELRTFRFLMLTLNLWKPSHWTTHMNLWIIFSVSAKIKMLPVPVNVRALRVILTISQQKMRAWQQSCWTAWSSQKEKIFAKVSYAWAKSWIAECSRRWL